jgi:hypothetical protein
MERKTAEAMKELAMMLLLFSKILDMDNPFFDG